MPIQFNFQPFVQPYTPAPTEAIAETQGELMERYDQAVIAEEELATELESLPQGRSEDEKQYLNQLKSELYNSKKRRAQQGDYEHLGTKIARDVSKLQRGVKPILEDQQRVQKALSSVSEELNKKNGRYKRPEYVQKIQRDIQERTGLRRTEEGGWTNQFNPDTANYAAEVDLVGLIDERLQGIRSREGTNYGRTGSGKPYPLFTEDGRFIINWEQEGVAPERTARLVEDTLSSNPEAVAYLNQIRKFAMKDYQQAVNNGINPLDEKVKEINQRIEAYEGQKEMKDYLKGMKNKIKKLRDEAGSEEAAYAELVALEKKADSFRFARDKYAYMNESMDFSVNKFAIKALDKQKPLDPVQSPIKTLSGTIPVVSENEPVAEALSKRANKFNDEIKNLDAIIDSDNAGENMRRAAEARKRTLERQKEAHEKYLQNYKDEKKELMRASGAPILKDDSFLKDYPELSEFIKDAAVTGNLGGKRLGVSVPGEGGESYSVAMESLGELFSTAASGKTKKGTLFSNLPEHVKREYRNLSDEERREVASQVNEKVSEYENFNEPDMERAIEDLDKKYRRDYRENIQEKQFYGFAPTGEMRDIIKRSVLEGGNSYSAIRTNAGEQTGKSLSEDHRKGLNRLLNSGQFEVGQVYPDGLAEGNGLTIEIRNKIRKGAQDEETAVEGDPDSYMLYINKDTSNLKHLISREISKKIFEFSYAPNTIQDLEAATSDPDRQALFDIYLDLNKDVVNDNLGYLKTMPAGEEEIIEPENTEYWAGERPYFNDEVRIKRTRDQATGDKYDLTFYNEETDEEETVRGLKYGDLQKKLVYLHLQNNVRR